MKPKLLLILSFAAFLTACNDTKTVSAAPETVSGVQVGIVEGQPVPDVAESVGTVHAAESAEVSAQMMGNILSINVREGDIVRRGQLLVVLDDAQPRAGLDRSQAAMTAADHEAQAAESEHALAQSTLKRFDMLYERKSVSPQEYEEVKTRALSAAARRDMAHAAQGQAKAAISQAQTVLEYTRVRAPFDGVVTERRMDPGALASPGMPIVTVESGGRFRLEAELDEQNLALARIGESVPVKIDALGTTALAGKIIQIVPAAHAASRSFTVKIELPQSLQLRSGLFGRAEFSRGLRNVLVIPATSVINRGQMQSVYVVGSDGLASLRYVTLGAGRDGGIEVLSGLTAGDRIVLTPGERDLGGKKIEARS
jgi:RND family efflux transporter MFP subunit